MADAVPDLAAIDEVINFFEEEVAASVPLYNPEQKFRLLGDESGLLVDQPLNVKFFRQFDVLFAGDADVGESYLPLERVAKIVIQIGYLGSVRNRRVRKIIRQDEELLARRLLRPDAGAPSDRPYNWDVVPPMQTDEIGRDGAATVVSITYQVAYTCDAV
jgi:hypothetical protein